MPFTEQDFVALAERLNVATNKIKAKLDAAAVLVANAGLPSDKEAEIGALLNAAIEPLEAMGADPANPVPEVPEV